MLEPKPKRNQKKTKKPKIRRLYGARHFPQIFGFLGFFGFFRESDVWKGRERKAEEKNLSVFALKVPNAPKSFQTIFH